MISLAQEPPETLTLEQHISMLVYVMYFFITKIKFRKTIIVTTDWLTDLRFNVPLDIK